MSSCYADELAYLDFAKENLDNKNPILMDVGINVGDFTQEFLDRFPNAICYGFEPIPEIATIARDRFKENKNVHIHNFGLYNEVRIKKPFYFVKNLKGDGADNSGMSSIHYRPIHYPKFDYEVILLDFNTFDDISHNFLPVDYMKIDTEGSELMVLQGAKEFLKHRPPQMIQWEYGGCYQDSKTTGKQVIEFLSKFNYTTVGMDLWSINSEEFVEDYQLKNYLSILDY